MLSRRLFLALTGGVLASPDISWGAVGVPSVLDHIDDRAGLLPFFIEWSADTVHPSADAPPGCIILRFELSAPNSAELQRICTVLNLDVPVTHGERPQLLARIVGPDGRLMALAS